MEHYEGRTGEAGEQIRQEAREWANQAAAQGKGLFEEQKRLVAEQVAGLADALHTTAQRLQEDKQQSAAHYADWAASSLARVAGQLRERDLRNLMQGAERYASGHPALFLGGAVLAGFLLSRLLKSTSDRPSSEYGAASRESGETGRVPVRGPDYEPTERMGIEM